MFNLDSAHLSPRLGCYDDPRGDANVTSPFAILEIAAGSIHSILHISVCQCLCMTVCVSQSATVCLSPRPLTLISVLCLVRPDVAVMAFNWPVRSLCLPATVSGIPRSSQHVLGQHILLPQYMYYANIYIRLFY